MPEASSMIRRVPGGNVGPAGGDCSDENEGSATGVAVPELPTNSAAPTTATSTTTQSPRIQGVRFLGGGAGGWNSGTAGRTGGARTGEDCTATPGPAGVATSDQLIPFHHRTIPAAPSGSGYHPGAGCSGPVTRPA